MRIAMIGSGYVGLVSGACLADFGHDVTCVDNDKEKISTLNRGTVPIFEPGLADLIANNMCEGRLAFTSDVSAAVSAAGAVFSSQSERRHAAATAMPICPMSLSRPRISSCA